MSLNPEQMRVKLPTIRVSPFDGSYTDFVRFWSMFTEEVDKTSLASTSKFTYLKEMVSRKVRVHIDGLPFSTEGYTRAKAILQNKYGKASEIVNSHVQGLMNLPTINGSNPTRIYEFYENFVQHVQALETMGKLESVNGYARLILDRLPGIRADLVRDDESWQEWTFQELADALRRWTERNPVSGETKQPHQRDGRNGAVNGDQRRERMFHTGDRSHQSQLKGKCVYCQSEEHKSVDCAIISTPSDRKRFLALNKLCFNCTGGQHQASRCTSRRSCKECNSRHHSSICEKLFHSNKPSDVDKKQPMLMIREPSVIYPVVIVKVNGVKCRALLDTGAVSSYISAGKRMWK